MISNQPTALNLSGLAAARAARGPSAEGDYAEEMIRAYLDAIQDYPEEDHLATLRYCEEKWSEERGVMIDKLMAARGALKAMLLHSCVADSAPEDKFPEDHVAERVARNVIEGLRYELG